MKLSELKTGERGVIVKVYGHGSFRKRIIEMGFVKGNKVKVILNAPLRDPIEYEIIGYKISLRRDEADKIEVISESEAKLMRTPFEALPALESEEDWIEREMNTLAQERDKVIKVALVGNPNCGKTSLFNIASGGHEHVGNYSGVTVDAKEGTFEHGGYRFLLVDLPGTYSLSAYSPEERYVRRNLIDEMPDVVVNVVDSSNLQRNLYLTAQLIDMNLRVVMALNMYDELLGRGDKLDIKQLGYLLGMPVVPTISRNGEGIDALFDTVVQVYEKADPHIARHIHINHGADLELSIDRIKLLLQKNTDIRYKYSTRYLAIKYLENDKEIEKVVESLENRDEIIAARFEENARIRELLGSALAALDSSGGHNCRHITSKSHHHRYEGLAMQTHLMHHPIHDERSPGHISGILQQRYEHIQQHDIRQEDQHTADSSDDTIHHQILQPTFRHRSSDKVTELLYHPLDPLHRILTYDEGSAENQIKK